ncbi:MAG: hypothetical protein ACYDFT_01855 [Thermoplasmata archaeon]
MTRAWILVYEHRPATSGSRINRLHHRLFGYKDRSNHGRYEYERPGLLSGRPFLYLRRGALVLPLDVGEAARQLVVAEKARAWLRQVELEPEDERRLGRAAAGSRPVNARPGRAKKGSKGRRKLT